MKKLIYLLFFVTLMSCECIGQLPDQILYVDENCEGYVPDYLPMITVSDNCGIDTVIQIPESGFKLDFNNPQKTIAIIASDVFGNETSMFFDVILLDTISPIIDIIPVDTIPVILLYIGNDEIAKENILRNIPKQYIDLARTTLHIAYQHTSHGTHVSRGMFGLQDFKNGDDALFGISTSQQIGKLDFRDYALSSYTPPGINGTDLSHDETAFIQTTRNYLDDPANPEINVIMWSWCNIAGHNVSDNYLPGMNILISEYGFGGSKIGTGQGQRQNPVTFIFMTGHANVNNNVGTGKPKNQAGLINNYCKENKQFCLDYYTIDTYDMDDRYWQDAGDNGNSLAYGGNFYEDWEDSHTLGVDYFENKISPDGNVEYGAHNTQHITANRKAYAMWWILARIAGWDGN